MLKISKIYKKEGMKLNMNKKVIASGIALVMLSMQTLPVLGYTKDETVYAKIKTNGENYKTIVNSHLSNMKENEEIIDKSILEEIENVNGEQEFTKQEDNKIMWKTNKEDIYYEGNTDKQLPITCEIIYKLDGEEIEVNQIAGKTGKVEIIIKYINKEEHKVNIEGKEETMYTPFVVVLGTIMDNSKAKNIQISSGKIIDNGKNTVVTGIVLPGMQDNLGLNKDEVNIPDSITITLDATEFELGNMYSYITPKLFENSDIENLDKLEELYNQVDTLTNSSSQIVDGVNTLNNGANTLNNKTDQFSNAIKTYTQGVNTVGQNYNKIDRGIQSLDDGMSTLSNGANAINNGVSELSLGISALNKGINQGKNQAIKSLTSSKETLVNGLELLIQGKDKEIAGIEQVISQGNNNLGLAIKTNINKNLSNIDNAMQQVLGNSNLAFTEAQKQAVQQVLSNVNSNTINTGIEQAVAVATNNEVEAIRNINNNKDGVKQNMKNMKQQSEVQFNQGISEISEGFEEINDGTVFLQDSVNTKLASGASQLYSGTQSLKQGSSTLKAGSTQIKNGVDTLSASGTQLTKASDMLSNGTTELLSGTGQLKDGVQEFDSEGIGKISELVNKKVKSLEERTEQMKKLANEYNEFSGKEVNIQSTVKFIMMTDKVEKKENAIMQDQDSDNWKKRKEEK